MPPDVEYVEVQLELGHQAIPKEKDGFTHQWTLFVRGPDDCKIEEFVDRVVFNLHESFAKPLRSFREPPFSVKEYGYAGFELPIDIYFKNKEEPKKITYMYDLFLHTNDSVHNTRREKLTFQNPSPDFKKKLLRAGGKCYPDPKGKSGSSSLSVPKHKSKSSPLTPAPTSPRDVKPSLKSAPPKHRVPQKDIPTHSSSGLAPSASSAGKSVRDKPPITKPTIKREPDTFTDLFGPPLQSRPSPDPTKHREQSRKPRVEKEIRVKSEKPESVPSSKSSAESSVPSKKSPSRPSSPNVSKSEDKSSKRSKGKKKKKRERSSSCSSQGSDSPDRSESCHRTDSKSKSEKDRKTKVRGKDIRTVTPVSTSASSSQQKSKKKNFTSTTISFSNSDNTGRTMSVEIKSVTKEKTYDSESKKSKNKEFNNSETVDADVGQSQDRKREISSSPVSSSSDPTANGATANGSCEDLSSPRSRSSRGSSDPASRRRKNRESESDADTDLTARDKKWKRSGAGDSSGGEEDASARREDYLKDLYWIQKRINESTDANLLQRIVDMVEVRSSEYEVTTHCIEFDLVRLDGETLSKLKQMVEKG